MFSYVLVILANRLTTLASVDTLPGSGNTSSCVMYACYDTNELFYFVRKQCTHVEISINIDCFDNRLVHVLPRKNVHAHATGNQALILWHRPT